MEKPRRSDPSGAFSKLTKGSLAVESGRYVFGQMCGHISHATSANEASQIATIAVNPAIDVGLR